MHFCADELLALLAVLPFIGGIIAGVRARWRRWRQRPAPPTMLAEVNDYPSACTGHCCRNEHHPRCATNSWDPTLDIERGYVCTCEVHEATDRSYRGL